MKVDPILLGKIITHGIKLTQIFFKTQKIDFEIKTIEKGPIYFSDNQVKLNLPQKTIAVFGYENSSISKILELIQ